jgi:hypothetical protein
VRGKKLGTDCEIWVPQGGEDADVDVDVDVGVMAVAPT